MLSLQLATRARIPVRRFRECPADPRDVPWVAFPWRDIHAAASHQPHNLVDITRAGDPNVRRLLAVHLFPGAV